MQCRLPKKRVLYIPDLMTTAPWSLIIYACKNNVVPSSWGTGSSKKMTIDGTSYQIDVIGVNHDEYADGSGIAPLTFQMHDCYNTKYAMNSSRTNVGGWADSEIRNTHLPAILAQMPSEVQSAIREVNKLTSAGNKSTTINTTADKLFLLSEIEIFGSVTNSVEGEGSQYEGYVYGATDETIKKVNGTASDWLSRSPEASTRQGFCNVDSNGNAFTTSAGTSQGVSFAFCF